MEELTKAEEEVRELVFQVYVRLQGKPGADVALMVLIPLITLKYLNDQVKNQGFELKISSEAQWGKLSQAQHHHIIERLLIAYTVVERDNPSLKGVFTKLGVVDNYHQVFYKTPNSIDVLLDFINDLSQFDFTQTDFSFGDLFEWLLSTFNNTYERRLEPGALPKALAELMTYFLPEEPVNIYNPYAGIGDLAPYILPNKTCVAQEITYTASSLGALRVLAHQAYSYTLEQQIPSENWLWEAVTSEPPGTFRRAGSQHHFDVLMTMVPFNRKIHDSQGKSLRSEAWLLSKLLESFQPHQRAIVLLSSGTLFRGGEEAKIRKDLIKKDLIETIISLPAGLLNYTRT